VELGVGARCDWKHFYIYAGEGWSGGWPMVNLHAVSPWPWAREWVGNSRSTRGLCHFFWWGSPLENDPHRPYLIVAVDVAGAARRLFSWFGFAQRPKRRRQAGRQQWTSGGGTGGLAGGPRSLQVAPPCSAREDHNSRVRLWVLVRNNGASLAYVLPAAYRVHKLNDQL